MPSPRSYQNSPRISLKGRSLLLFNLVRPSLPNVGLIRVQSAAVRLVSYVATHALNEKQIIDRCVSPSIWRVVHNGVTLCLESFRSSMDSPRNRKAL